MAINASYQALSLSGHCGSINVLQDLLIICQCNGIVDLYDNYLPRASSIAYSLSALPPWFSVMASTPDGLPKAHTSFVHNHIRTAACYRHSLSVLSVVHIVVEPHPVR